MDGLSHASLGDRLEVEAGVARLFDEEWSAMVRMAALMVGSAAVAEEIVQDAFSQVAVRWESLDRPGAYLRTCVVNGCSVVLRRRSLRDRQERRWSEPTEVELPTRLIELRDALDRLSERQRVVVVLRYFVDLPDAEIAQILGVRRATVRSLARRSLAVLREELR